MARHVFQRDFTLCKAALLAGLIGVAGLLGQAPLKSAEATAQPDTPQAVPVVVRALVFWTDCDADKTPKQIDL